MKIIFISLVSEPNPDAYKRSYLGKLATRHDLVGVSFDEMEDALKHQDALLVGQRGGVMHCVVGDPKNI